MLGLFLLPFFCCKRGCLLTGDDLCHDLIQSVLFFLCLLLVLPLVAIGSLDRGNGCDLFLLEESFLLLVGLLFKLLIKEDQVSDDFGADLFLFPGLLSFFAVLQAFQFSLFVLENFLLL